MGTELLETQPAAGVTRLQLHRPERRNALNLALRRELAEAFERLDRADTTRVILLAGVDKAFCAGADLNEYLEAGPAEIAARRMDRLWGAIAHCGKPVIAAVRGFAIGGGCELALHADLIVAGDTARFGQPEVKIGIMAGGGATQRLTQAVGKFRALKILLTGRPFTAQEAFEMGLCSEVVPDDEVDTRALALAEELAALPTSSLQSTKDAVLASMNLGLDRGLAYERHAFQLLFATEDKREGMAAQLEKRQPRFNRGEEH